MPELLSEQDRLKLAQAADYVHRAYDEADRANQEMKRLKQADDATLCAILDDRRDPTSSRRIALTALIRRDHLRRDGTLAKIILPLMDDPDDEVAELAIQFAFAPP